MHQDYCGKNLRGHSFKRKTLTGANFSNAEIQGADFTDAILIGANFSHTQAGLQKRCAIFLALVSWVLSGLSGFLSGFAGYLAALVLDVTNFQNYVAGLTAIGTLVIFFFITIRYGIQVGLVVFVAVFAVTLAGAIALAGAGATDVAFAASLAVAFAGALAFFGTSAGALALVLVLAVARYPIVAGNLTIASAAAIVGVLTLRHATSVVGAITIVEAIFLHIAVAFSVAAAIILLSTYISWRAFKGDPKQTLIRNSAIAFTASKGTSFRNADLTDANFTEATLKSTDFRKAILTRTCWQNAKKLDYVRPGETYLQDVKLRQLLVTGQGQGKNFDKLDLRGLNLSATNLQNASFIGTDFYQSSLKEANLTGAMLVRAQFESTDLTGATLTGACIEDWVVTRTTKLYGVKCKYAFMKFSENGDKRDQIPPKGEFKNDDFILFVQSVLDTIKLYHERDVNPKLALYVLQTLSEDYQCTLEIVKIEKRGESGAIIEVKIPGSFNQEKLKETYYEKYNQYLKFYMTDPKNELKSPTNIENVTVHKGVLIGGSVSNSTVAYTIDTEGDTIMPEGSKQQFNHDLRHAQIAGGLVNADTVSAHQIGGNINNYTPQQRQNLAEAAREIQQLLQQLEQTNPTTTTSEKMTVVAKAVDEIEKNPTLKARVIGALKSGGKEALKEAIDNPLVNILMASIEGWQEA